MSSEVLAEMSLRMQVFQDVTMCHWMSGSWYFEGMKCLQNTGNHSPSNTALHPTHLNLQGVKYLSNTESCISQHIIKSQIPSSYWNQSGSFSSIKNKRTNVSNFFYPSTCLKLWLTKKVSFFKKSTMAIKTHEFQILRHWVVLPCILVSNMKWFTNLMQLSIYLCSLSSTCFGLIRPSSGAMDVTISLHMQHMVSLV